MGDYLQLMIISKFNESEFIFLTYLLIINTISFLIMAIDKSKAKNKKHRISEAMLIGIASLGGCIGTLLAMVVFKHKTNKKKFSIGVPIIYLINQIIIIIILNSIK